MANSDAPQGLKIWQQGLAAGTSAQVNPYFYPSSGTLLFVGDPVVVTGTANTTAQGIGGKWAPGTLPEIAVATAGAGNGISGVVVGFETAATPNNDIAYNPATTPRVVLVCDDPHMLYEIQSDSANATAVTDISSNADIVLTHAGSTTTGLSGVELDTSDMSAAATGQLRIVRLVPRENNALGTHSKLVVGINMHKSDNTIVGI